MLERIGIGLALSDLEDPDFRIRGQNFCMAQIDDLCADPASVVCHEQIQNIVTFLYRSEGLSKHTDSFIKMLSMISRVSLVGFFLNHTIDSASAVVMPTPRCWPFLYC